MKTPPTPSDSLHTRVLGCVGQAVVATDLQGRIIFWNDFAESLYGWSALEAMGRNIVDVTPSPDMVGMASEIMSSLQLGERWSGEMTLQRRDGSTFPALVTDAPLYDEQHVLIGIVGVAVDITAQKRVERELRDHRLQLAVAQDIARVGSWTYNFVTGERQWSDAFLRLVGVPPGGSFTIEDAFARVHPDDRAGLRAMLATAHERFGDGATSLRMLTPGGQRDMLLRYTVEVGAAGEPTRAVAVVQDVTETRQLEEELLRRGTQQSALARLAQYALSGASTSLILNEAIHSIGAVMQFDTLAVVQHAVVVPAAEPGNDGTEIPGRLSIPIHSADGAEWGRLSASWSEIERVPEAYDLEFLRAGAAILSQALDRAAADVALQTLARRQSAIAEMGRLALTSVNANGFDGACELVRIGTQAEWAFAGELTETGGLRVGAGRGSAPLADAHSRDAEAQMAAVLLQGTAVLHDYSGGPFQHTSSGTVSAGMLSAIMVPVASASRHYGVLAAQSSRAHAFDDGDLAFAQSIANMLADGMGREEARVQLTESEDRYRRIFDGVSEAIFSIDTTGKFTALSRAFETITGLPRSEWLGRSFAELIAPDDRPRSHEVFRGLLRNENTENELLAVIGAHGLVDLEVSTFAASVGGEVTELYGFARNVSEARRLEAERARVTRSLQLLLESTIEGIFTFDLDGRCTMVNRAAATSLGMAAKSVLGHDVHALLGVPSPPGNSCSHPGCPVHGVLRDGEPRAVTGEVFSRMDGSVIPVALSAAPINDEDVRVGAVVTFTNLTERRRLEAKLEQANRLTSLGRLAATVAHEFNNVLMGIAPFVDLLRRSPPPAEVATALNHIGSSVRRGRRITENILRFTQPAEPVRGFIELATWMEAIRVEGMSLLGPRYDIRVRADKLQIEADTTQLHQIFVNLLLNARDAMPGGGVITLSASCEQQNATFPFGVLEHPERYAHIVAADTGIGMSDETLRHAFEPLFTTKRSGTGLGLAVTHQVVQRHGGEIFIESTPGAGSAFHIFLPLVAERSQLIAAAVAEANEHPVHRREILLVEDDPSVAIGLRALLEAEGFSVCSVATGQEALDALIARVPDAVILDVGLPDMDGRVVFARLAAMHPQLPVVFSTGHTDRGGLEELLTQPHVGYLKKPYEGAVLMSALHSVMSVSFAEPSVRPPQRNDCA